MKKDILEHCPICGFSYYGHKTEHGYTTPLKCNDECEAFSCTNPLANNPLHYYRHIIRKSRPNEIAYQEFTIDIGTKYVMVGINLISPKTFIHNSKDDNSLEIDLIIKPDFPDLELFKKKIRTAITFS